MSEQAGKDPRPVALVTGGGARIGAEIVRHLHAGGYNVLVHFNLSQESALALAMTLNTQRDRSVHCLHADLLDMQQIEKLAQSALSHWGRLDVLVNNAASFFPTPLGKATEADWQALFNANVKAPFFLSQQLAPAIRERGGCILNILDVYAHHALHEYSIYSMSKAALASMTRALAKELAPEARVNGIAPGAILWPATAGEDGVSQEYKESVLAQTCLKHLGEPADIARAVWFLIDQAPYVTGQILTVDGGRSLLV